MAIEFSGINKQALAIGGVGVAGLVGGGVAVDQALKNRNQPGSGTSTGETLTLGALGATGLVAAGYGLYKQNEAGKTDAGKVSAHGFGGPIKL